jgi:hypothetical protein
MTLQQFFEFLTGQPARRKSSRAANQGLRWMAAQPILRYSASLTVLLIKYAT